MDAMKALTHSVTAHDGDEGGAGMLDEDEEEDLRDGRFVCEICGRAE